MPTMLLELFGCINRLGNWVARSCHQEIKCTNPLESTVHTTFCCQTGFEGTRPVQNAMLTKQDMAFKMSNGCVIQPNP